MLATGMAEGIGVYGGVWRDFSACPTEGLQPGRGAERRLVWYRSRASFASLLKSGPIYPPLRLAGAASLSWPGVGNGAKTATS